MTHPYRKHNFEVLKVKQYSKLIFKLPEYIMTAYTFETVDASVIHIFAFFLTILLPKPHFPVLLEE